MSGNWKKYIFVYLWSENIYKYTDIKTRHWHCHYMDFVVYTADILDYG